MQRTALIGVAMFALGALSVLAGSWFTRAGSASPVPLEQRRVAVAPSLTQGAQPAGAESAAQTPAREAAAPQPVTPDVVAQWKADATGKDPKARAAAIAALATAPRSQATPVLAQALTVADDSERPLVLQSLRTLARRQGDDDDRIRSVVRNVVFHESDEAFAQAARVTLDDIERDLSPAARTAHP